MPQIDANRDRGTTAKMIAETTSSPLTSQAETSGSAPGLAVRPKAAPRRVTDAPGWESLTRLLWDAYWEDPCDEHRNLLVEAYQYVVQSLVRRLSARLPRSIERGDLVTAGNVGLMGAICNYDQSRGVRFESYCEMRVRGSLLDELRTQDWLPRPWRHRIEAHKRVREELRSQLGRRPSDTEVSRAMGMNLGEYEFLFGTGLPGTPRGAGIGADGEDDGGLDIVADVRSATPEERLTREEILRLVAQKLTEQEYRILYLKYWEDLSMREIGQLVKLSESRVCKIHMRLIERLQDRLRAHSPQD